MITSVAVVRAYADERRYHATNYIRMLVTGGDNIVRIELSGASSVWVSKTNSGATLREMLAYSSRTRVSVWAAWVFVKDGCEGIGEHRGSEPQPVGSKKKRKQRGGT